MPYIPVEKEHREWILKKLSENNNHMCICKLMRSLMAKFRMSAFEASHNIVKLTDEIEDLAMENYLTIKGHKPEWFHEDI